MQTQTNALGQRSSYTYDALGRPTGSTDPLNRSLSIRYDALGRAIEEVRDARGIKATVGAAYDALDQTSAIVDPKQLATVYLNNGLGDTLGVASPDTGDTLQDHDAAGNLASRITSDGHRHSYRYDAANRLTHDTVDDGSAIVYHYDMASDACPADESYTRGQLAGMTDPSGGTDYCYDRFGRVTRKIQTAGGITVTLRYAYTRAGRLAAVTYPDGSVVRYAYDAWGQLTSIDAELPGQGAQSVLSQIASSPFGGITGWTAGGGRSLIRRFDEAGRVMDIRDARPDGLALAYTYDAASQLTGLDVAGVGMRYSYDGLGRLLETRQGETLRQRYAYDATGNRQSLSDATGEHAYRYADDSHHLLRHGGIEQRYDAAGHLVERGALSFTYDARGRLANVMHQGGIRAHYSYNGPGERVSRQVGDATTVSLYDESGHWLGDYARDG